VGAGVGQGGVRVGIVQHQGKGPGCACALEERRRGNGKLEAGEEGEVNETCRLYGRGCGFSLKKLTGNLVARGIGFPCRNRWLTRLARLRVRMPPSAASPRPRQCQSLYSSAEREHARRENPSRFLVFPRGHA
jgi:hypothetical protein